MKIKKLLSVILCLVITISSLSFAAVSVSAAEITPVTPQTDSSGVYQIGTAAELYGFAQLVNSKTEPSANAVLTADITVNTGVLKADGTLNSGTFTDWTPIGWYDYDNNVYYSYTGTFDGQGHTISGLYFNDTSTENVGLFGFLGTDSEIKNIGVIDSYFKGYWYVGGVCGENFGTITGCYNTGTVSVSGAYVGGVCGENYGTITGCYNTGTVTRSGSYVGGVCGYNRSTITGCYTNNGGVYGKNNNGIVTDCEEYKGDEFKDGTVCALLNKAIGSDCDFMFYQGEEIPLFFSKTENRYCTVNYAVNPTYTVTIPKTVKLGETATIKAEDVILEEEKQLKVTLTGTSGENNAFKVKSAEGAELTYTVNDGTKDISIDETVLTVNPDNSANGSATLKFNAPSASDIIYAGKYEGTVTFTVSVERE